MKLAIEITDDQVQAFYQTNNCLEGENAEDRAVRAITELFTFPEKQVAMQQV